MFGKRATASVARACRFAIAKPCGATTSMSVIARPTKAKIITNPASGSGFAWRVNYLQSREMSSGTSAIADALTKEILEEDVDVELDQELIDAQQQLLQNFTIEDTDGIGVVALKRSYNDETIVVEFDCQSGEEDDPFQGFDFQEPNVIDSNSAGASGRGGSTSGGDDEDFDEGYAKLAGGGSNFEVRINRGGNTILIDCCATENLEVRNVRYISASNQSTDIMNIYAGPKFHELDENLQAAFYDYLAERGIDDDLSFFVLSYSRDKEQREYVMWLKQLLDFTAK